MRAGRTLGRIGLTTLLFPLGRNLKGCKFPTVVVMVFMTHQTTCTIVKQQRLHACRVSYTLAVFQNDSLALAGVQGSCRRGRSCRHKSPQQKNMRCSSGA